MLSGAKGAKVVDKVGEHFEIVRGEFNYPITLTKDGKRAVPQVLIIVNPIDYWEKIFPSTSECLVPWEGGLLAKNMKHYVVLLVASLATLHN